MFCFWIFWSMVVIRPSKIILWISSFAALAPNLHGMIGENCTPILACCKYFPYFELLVSHPLDFSCSCFLIGVFSWISYPYGHEELAVCEDIDQVCICWSHFFPPIGVRCLIFIYIFSRISYCSRFTFFTSLMIFFCNSTVLMIFLILWACS